MDDVSLDLLAYLDSEFIRNLSSIASNGCIEIRTTRLIRDKSLCGKIEYDTRKNCIDEDRNSDENRDGFITNNNSKSEHIEETASGNLGAENREIIRTEEEVKRLYTSCTLYNQVLEELKQNNKIKELNNIDIKKCDLVEGEYVKVKGNLTSESITAYLDVLLTICKCFGCKSLDEIMQGKESSIMKFNIINNILIHLNELLNINSTQDMILKCGDTSIVLNVNKNFFMNNNSYIFDKIDCPCTVFGKVVCIAEVGQYLSLLRKTGQRDFYENILNSCIPCYEALKISGITVPKMPRLRIYGLSLVIVPISICM